MCMWVSIHNKDMRAIIPCWHKHLQFQDTVYYCQITSTSDFHTLIHITYYLTVYSLDRLLQLCPGKKNNNEQLG